ncbi:MAG: asparagine synthase (glutamine-hydrolyzing) [Sphingomonas sp.]|uniref:asparagine synthase (glutamine-hydrolyzing) n=1 Tax=Sphingomonas sp. TaxID=28214 RepID=UPI001ACFE21B|nr:asparagine synthase (glutamine-hydrolyzing) [Sphingomonas sp.]MBN8806902.1 asparagine synthase (glutamine-hydrolyzing) [Sphingomonas sp.]
MCGIAGYLADYSPHVAARMASAIAHRGPDGHGIFADTSRVALAHARLSVIDLSTAGHQPMTDASGRYTIVYNGEIYNYRELRRDLLADAKFRGESDTEVLIEGYARYGTDFFRKLNGIFALAIWDGHDQTLILARDGLGVKPLYVYRDSRGIAFASEIKAMLAIPGMDRTTDPVAAAAYISYLWSPGERTMFQSVRKLSPGTWARWNTVGGCETGSFYTLPNYSSDPAGNTDHLIARTTDLVRQAVHRQMVSDVDVGAFLSGGLDSSAVVAFARECSNTRLQCFTIDYGGTGDDAAELVADLPYAQSVARHLDVDLHTVKVDASMANEFEQLIWLLDEPEADPAALNNLHIAALARANGIKVLLSGTGGDDIFTGYRRHQAAQLETWIDATPSFLRRAGASTAELLPVDRPLTRRLRKIAQAASRSSDERLASYFEWLPLEDVGRVMHKSSPHLIEQVREPLITTLRGQPNTNALERLLRVDQRFFLTDHNLNYTDKTGMAHGVEIRVPLLDRDLMAFAATVPTRYKLRRGTTKWVFRRAMEPILPREVIYRPKTGFGVPLRAWLKGPMREMIADLTSAATINSRGLFDTVAVQQLRDATLSGKVDGAYSLLAVGAIELWCRRFIDLPVAH